MEHIILFAICTLIMRLSVPVMTYEGDKLTDSPFMDAATTTSFAAAMAVPLWAAFEVIYWVGNYFLA
jgi:hypothetical protein